MDEEEIKVEKKFGLLGRFIQDQMKEMIDIDMQEDKEENIKQEFINRKKSIIKSYKKAFAGNINSKQNLRTTQVVNLMK